jgi:hypothetical protein
MLYVPILPGAMTLIIVEVPVLIWHSIVSPVKDMLVTKESPSVYQLFLKPQELNWKIVQCTDLTINQDETGTSGVLCWYMKVTVLYVKKRPDTATMNARCVRLKQKRKGSVNGKP